MIKKILITVLLTGCTAGQGVKTAPPVKTGTVCARFEVLVCDAKYRECWCQNVDANLEDTKTWLVLN
jgi:hypothetical protein